MTATCPAPREAVTECVVGGTVQVALLAGPDHPRLRDLATCGLGTEEPDGPRLGAATSAGWMPKAVPAVEPNEDGALLATGPGGTLLAVADGHGGSAAAVAALRAMAEQAPALLRTPGDCMALVRAFAAAAHMAVTRLPAPLAAVDEPEPRTALTVLVATDGEFALVGYGDTVAVTAHAGRARVLTEPTEFLGPSSPPDPFEGHAVTGRRRRLGEALVVVSDGVPDYLGRAFASTVATLTTGRRARPDAVRVAESLVTRAGDAGAGDNITAAVLLDRQARPRLPFLARR